MFKNASYLMRFVFRELLARWRRISQCRLHVTYIVDDYTRRFICCMCRRQCGCIIRWVCTYLCVSFCFLLFVFHYECSSQYKLALLSEAATVLARSSSVDVLYVRLRVYALSAVVVPASKKRQWHQYVLFASTMFMRFQVWDSLFASIIV